MKALYICGALAAGEFLASHFSNFADAWPVFAIAALLVFMLGYGYGVRGAGLLAVFICGISLYLAASVGREHDYREKPWMRHARTYERQYGGAHWPAMTRLRRDLSRRVSIGLEHDPETAALNRAILLGERKQLSPDMRKVFVDSGTIHLFAISGLHVMAVAGTLVFMMAFLSVPLRLAGAVSIPVLWLYVAMIGFTPSAVRAATMATFCLMAPIWYRRPDGLRAWALTFILVHVISPLRIDDVGNALSFTVMLSLVLASRMLPQLNGFSAALVTTLIAWAAGTPIAAHVFGRVTPGGILSNLALLGTATWTVMTGVVGVVCSFFSYHLAVHVNNFSALLTRMMVTVAEVVSRLPGSSFAVRPWSLAECAAWYAVLILVIALWHRRRHRQLF